MATKNSTNVSPTGPGGIKEVKLTVPHPNTLKSAAEYEYYGHYPLSYAIAELIDNGIQATVGKSNRVIDLNYTGSGSSQQDNETLIIRDSGHGMTHQELESWARLGHSQQFHTESKTQTGKEYSDKHFVSSLIARHGIGSKFAIFFIGRKGRVITRSEYGGKISEAIISQEAMDALEKKKEISWQTTFYWDREPGFAGNLDKNERSEFLEKMIEKERESEETFTVFVISDLKDSKRQYSTLHLKKELSLIYHYYTYGPNGSIEARNAARTEEDAIMTKVPLKDTVKISVDEQNITNNEDIEMADLMSLYYYRASKDTFQFELEVDTEHKLWVANSSSNPTSSADNARVQGTLFYFPSSFIDGETVPQQHTLDDSTIESDQTILHSYWSGRLIPTAKVKKLYFMEFNDPQILSRVRGVLFFGPSFEVTKNKMAFKNEVGELLSKEETSRVIEYQNQKEKAKRISHRQIKSGFAEWIKLQHEKDEDLMLEDENIDTRGKGIPGRVCYSKIMFRHRYYSIGDVIWMQEGRKKNPVPAVIHRILFPLKNEHNPYQGINTHDGQVGLYRYMPELPVELQEQAKKNSEVWEFKSFNVMMAHLDEKEKKKELARITNAMPARLEVEAPRRMYYGEKIEKTVVTIHPRDKKKGRLFKDPLNRSCQLTVHLSITGPDKEIAYEAKNKNMLDKPWKGEFWFENYFSPKLLGTHTIEIEAAGDYYLPVKWQSSIEVLARATSYYRVKWDTQKLPSVIRLGSVLPPIKFTYFDSRDCMVPHPDYPNITLTVGSSGAYTDGGIIERTPGFPHLVLRDVSVLGRDPPTLENYDSDIPLDANAPLGLLGESVTSVTLEIKDNSNGQAIAMAPDVEPLTINIGAGNVDRAMIVSPFNPYKKEQLFEGQIMEPIKMLLLDRWNNPVTAECMGMEPPSVECFIKVTSNCLDASSRSAFLVRKRPSSGQMTFKNNLQFCIPKDKREPYMNIVVGECKRLNQKFSSISPEREHEYKTKLIVSASREPTKMHFMCNELYKPVFSKNNDVSILTIEVPAGSEIDGLSVVLKNSADEDVTEDNDSSTKITGSWFKGSVDLKELPPIKPNPRMSNRPQIFGCLAGENLKAELHVNIVAGPAMKWIGDCDQSEIACGEPVKLRIWTADAYDHKTTMNESVNPTIGIESGKLVKWKKESWTPLPLKGPKKKTRDVLPAFELGKNAKIVGPPTTVSLVISDKKDRLEKYTVKFNLTVGAPARIAVRIQSLGDHQTLTKRPKESGKSNIYDLECHSVDIIDGLYLSVLDEHGTIVPDENTINTTVGNDLNVQCLSSRTVPKDAKDGKLDMGRLSLLTRNSFEKQPASNSVAHSIEFSLQDVKSVVFVNAIPGRRVNRVEGTPRELPSMTVGHALPQVELKLFQENDETVVMDSDSDLKLVLMNDDTELSRASATLSKDGLMVVGAGALTCPTSVGQYDMCVEWTENRPGLRDMLKDPTTFKYCGLEVTHDEPARLVLKTRDGIISSQHNVTVSNYGAVDNRRIISRLSLSLVDSYDNICHNVSNLDLEFEVTPKHIKGKVPQLEGSTACTISEGQAKLTDLVVPEGTEKGEFTLQIAVKDSDVTPFKIVFMVTDDQIVTVKLQKLESQIQELEGKLHRVDEDIRDAKRQESVSREKQARTEREKNTLRRVLQGPLFTDLGQLMGKPFPPYQTGQEDEWCSNTLHTLDSVSSESDRKAQHRILNSLQSMVEHLRAKNVRARGIPLCMGFVQNDTLASLLASMSQESTLSIVLPTVNDVKKANVVIDKSRSSMSRKPNLWPLDSANKYRGSSTGGQLHFKPDKLLSSFKADKSFIGHAVNLIQLREEDEELRSTVFWSIYGPSMVFSDFDSAAKFRTLFKREYHDASVPLIICLQTAQMWKNNGVIVSITQDRINSVCFGKLPITDDPKYREAKRAVRKYMELTTFLEIADRKRKRGDKDLQLEKEELVDQIAELRTECDKLSSSLISSSSKRAKPEVVSKVPATKRARRR